MTGLARHNILYRAMEDYEVPQTEVQSYSGLGTQSLRAYIKLGLIPRPRLERKGHGSKVWYPQEVIGLLTVINRMKRQGMKLREIAELLTQREVVEGDEAMSMASSPMLSDVVETTMFMGNQLRSKRPDRELVTAVYDTEERDGELVMVPVKVVYVPKSQG